MNKRIIFNKRNPVLPLDIFIADGEAHVMKDGKLYIYGSCDQKQNQYCSTHYHVVETSDMEKWTVHLNVLDSEQLKWEQKYNIDHLINIDLQNPTPFLKKIMEEDSSLEKMVEAENTEIKPLLYAPDAIFYKGKYYLYFCMVGGIEGIAESESPTGPFLHAKMLPCRGIDPAIFEENEELYYFWGQFFLNGVKLNEDGISFQEERKVTNILTEEKHFFHEGASIRKIGEKYYMVFANMERGKPTSLGYAISDSLFGEYEYKGIIIDNCGCDPQSWNNHGSIECFQGQWYVFYHRSSRNSRVFRRLCIEPIQIDENGLIKEVKMTSQGAGEPFSEGEDIMGYQACQFEGKSYIDSEKDYGEIITGIEKGDKFYFRYLFVRSEKVDTIFIKSKGNAKLNIYLNQTKVASLDVCEEIEAYHILETDSGLYEIMVEVMESNHYEFISCKFYKGGNDSV